MEGKGEYGAAGALLLLGIGLLFAPKLLRRKAVATAATGEQEEDAAPTLAQLQQNDNLLAANGEAKAEAKPEAKRPVEALQQIALDRGIFRAYDIRGVVGKTSIPISPASSARPSAP